MKYAVKMPDGGFSGVVYDQAPQNVVSHHARYDEKLVPVSGLTNAGTDEAPVWQAVALSAEDWRRTAVLSRMEFVLACKRAGILSTDEAIEAAKGDWPASFADALADPDVGMDPDEAQIIWAAASQVERLHPLIAAVQTHRDMTDDEVDALFGYAPAS